MSENNKNENINDEFSFSDASKKYSDNETDLSAIENLFLELTTGKNHEEKKVEEQEDEITEHTESENAEMDNLLDYFESNMPKNFDADSPEVKTEIQQKSKVILESDKPKTVKGVSDRKIHSEGRKVIFSEDDESTYGQFKDEPKDIKDIKAPFMISANDIIEDDGIKFSDKELREKGFTEEDIKVYRTERNRALGVEKKEKGLKKIKKDFIPLKDDSVSEKIRKTILLFSVLVLIGCAIFFTVNYMQKLEAQKTPGVTEPISQIGDTEEDEWAKIKAQYPNVTFPEGMNIKYANLYATNQDTVGWLKIPNTNISTPVVQFKGDETRDEEFYLKHDFYKKSNKYGNPFMEWADDAFAISQNTVIHGHNMYDGLMFADLEKYMTLEGYKESPVITFNTLYGNYKWKIFAVIVTNGSSTGDNDYLFNFTVTCFESEAKMASFIEGLKERSLIDTGIDVNTSDKLLTLNTCCYSVNGVTLDDARLAVVARLVRSGESSSVDTSKAFMRENVRFPQMYYDRKGVSNPFANAYRWTAGN